jgi:arabinose-5-phosphate isomerase
VSADTLIKDAIYIMSAKRLGMTTVCDEDGRLLGIVTDGDLRRLFERAPDPLRQRAGDVMTTGPVTIEPDALATAALHVMEERHITSIVVVNQDRRVEGVVHLHDLWRTQLV